MNPVQVPMDLPDTPTPVADLVAAFLSSVYMADCQGNHIEVAIGHQAALLESAIDGKCFGFITAWNPLGQRRDDEGNNAADRELTHCIDSQRVERIPMLAMSPDGVWFEAGWLVCDVSRVTLDQWARRFGQLGTLWWQRGHAVKLRVYAPREAACDNVFIDWIE